MTDNGKTMNVFWCEAPENLDDEGCMPCGFYVAKSRSAAKSLFINDHEWRSHYLEWTDRFRIWRVARGVKAPCGVIHRHPDWVEWCNKMERKRRELDHRRMQLTL